MQSSKANLPFAPASVQRVRGFCATQAQFFPALPYPPFWIQATLLALQKLGNQGMPWHVVQLGV